MTRVNTPDTHTAAQLIATYEPTVVSKWEWKKIRHAVTECATYYYRRKGVLDATVPANRVSQILCVITRAAAYVRRHGGDLTIDVIAAPDVLQAVVREEAVDHAYSTIEAYIFNLTDFGRTVQPQQWVGKRLHHPVVAGHVDYLPRLLDDKELATARAWCSRDSATMTRSATAVVALSAGAGLGTAEIAARRVGHLRRDEWGVLWIDVSDIRSECFAPEVPVSMPWADDLWAAVAGKARDAFLVAPEQDGAVRHRVLRATVKRLKATAPHGENVDLKALRSNWVMSLFARGLSPRLIRYLSGTMNDFRRHEQAVFSEWSQSEVVEASVPLLVRNTARDIDGIVTQRSESEMRWVLSEGAVTKNAPLAETDGAEKRPLRKNFRVIDGGAQ